MNEQTFAARRQSLHAALIIAEVARLKRNSAQHMRCLRIAVQQRRILRLQIAALRGGLY